MENQMEWHEMEIDKNATPKQSCFGSSIGKYQRKTAQVIEVFEGSAA